MRFPKRLIWEMLERVIADAVMVNLALLTAFALRFVALLWLRGDSSNISSRFFAGILRDSVAAYLGSAPLLTPLCLIVFYLSGSTHMVAPTGAATKP
jgi:ABC-type uncharacterized transport system permease subunit